VITSGSLLLACGVIGLIAIPLALRMIPPNAFYGFRTPLTRSTPEIWYQANAFCGWAVMVASCVSALLLILAPAAAMADPPAALAAFLVPLTAAVIAAFVYIRRFA
jgi:SdpI/YfhL protein family